MSGKSLTGLGVVALVLIVAVTIYLNRPVGNPQASNASIPDGLFVQPGPGAEPVVAFKRDGKVGFLDRAGRISIQPRDFDFAVDFEDGLTLCRDKNSGVVINTKGNIVGRLPANATSLYRAGFERFWFQVDQKWGLCNQLGDVIVEPTYDDIDSFSDGLARVNIGGSWPFPGVLIVGGKTGYVDPDGKFVVPCELTEEFCWDFNEGHVVLGDSLVDRQLNKKITRPNIGDRISEGLVACQDFGTVTTEYVNLENEVAISIDGLGEDFSEGLAAVQRDEKFGYIDKTGGLVIPCQFEWAKDFKNGLAAVMTQNGWGYIDRNGKLVTPDHFNELKPASKKYGVAHYQGQQAPVMDGPTYWTGGRWILIDRTGTPLAVIEMDPEE